MSWVSAESSGSTSTWQNQIVHSNHYRPSGVLELFMYVLSLLLTLLLLASIFDHAVNTTITNSHIGTSITQVQARSTGV